MMNVSIDIRLACLALALSCGCGGPLMGSNSESTPSPAAASHSESRPGASSPTQQKELLKAVRAVFREADAHVRARETVGDDSLRDLEKSAAALRAAGLDDAAAYVDYAREGYALHNALRGGHAKEKLPQMLGATLVTDGTLEIGPRAGVDVDAKAGHCYVVHSGLAREEHRGGEIKPPWVFEAKKRAPLERFVIESRHPALRDDIIAGFCADVDASVTLAASYPKEEGNALAYVVVTTARSTFPAVLARDLRVDVPDACDVDGWTSAWRDPPPGALVYSKTEPLLAARGGGFLEPNGRRANLAGGSLAGTPPATVRIARGDQRHCERNDPALTTSARSRAVAECFYRADKPFRSLAGDAENALTHAKTEKERIDARARIAQVGRQRDDATAHCKHNEEALRGELEAWLDELEQTYRTQPPATSIDRAALDQQLSAGFRAIRAPATTAGPGWGGDP